MVIHMAKPIRATPELWKGDAKRFVEIITKNEKLRHKLTKKELQLAQAIENFPL